MKAKDRIRQLTDQAPLTILKEEDQTWLYANEIEKNVDFTTKLMWESHVPGSYAPESIMIAAVQALENRGYRVENSEALIEQGLGALKNQDMIELNKVSALLWHEINHAKKDETARYWTFEEYHSFEQHASQVAFPEASPVELETLFDKTYAGWLAQIIGGAFGTAMEGYTTKTIQETLGEVTSYIREPNTFNDDITFEIAFLEAYLKKGSAITSLDVALEWIGLVPTGWSAEEIALRNIRYGLFPPLSGQVSNPFSDWIGAQMRGAICGMIACGNPKEAARLAWIDGCVSHHNNGILGETFNAMLVSLSYVHQDMKQILDEVISLIPSKSEYYDFCHKAYQWCQTSETWLQAWKHCEAYCLDYNWIHAYPNVMAEIVALYFGENDFDKTLMIIGQCGQDVDCNAAQIMTALAIMNGLEKIPSKWIDPIGDRLDTYLREKKVMSIHALATQTVTAIRKGLE